MQRKKTKKFQSKQKNIDRKKKYTPDDAVATLLEASYEKFDPSFEVHIHTGIDPKKGEQVVRGSVVLPHASGKTKRIAVFADGDKAREAQQAGADIVGGKELIDEIKRTSKADFDIAIATPELMKSFTSIARILGPRGLMPSPKNNTVTNNITAAIAEVKKGRIDFKNDAGGNVHIVIGKKSLGSNKLLENYAMCIESIRKSRPASVKGLFIRSITLSCTMGPGISVQTA